MPSSDNLGTVRDVAEYDDVLDTTTIVDHYIYDAFGNETTGTLDFRFAYTGRAFDEETGLQNNLHRWYDPVVGRWLSEDPIAFAAEDANVYRYVGNAATGFVDPDGLAKHRTNRRESNRQPHEEGVVRGNQDRAGKAAREQAGAERRARQRAAHGGAPHDAHVKSTIDHIEAETKDLERQALRRKRKPSVELLDKIAENRELLGRLKDGLKRLAPGIGAIIIVADIAQFRQRCAEAGVARASLEVTPLLGDVVLITEDVQRTQAMLKGAAATSGSIEGVMNTSARSIATQSQRQTRETFGKLGKQVRVANFEYVNRERLAAGVANAATKHTNSVSIAKSAHANGKISHQQVDSLISAADAQFKRDLESAYRSAGGRIAANGPIH